MNFSKKNHSLSAIGVKLKKSNRNIVRKTLFKTAILLLLAFTIFSCSKDDATAIVEQPTTLSSISPLSGPKTTIVTITGTNFDTNAQKTKVFFDDLEATVQAITETTITAVVPARAFVGEVTVITNGRTLTGLQFEYLISDIQVTTLAGSTGGFADGTGANAQFNAPKGVTVDASNNLYVVDENNYKIRKITPNGVVSTFAGSTQGFADGTGANAQFNSPRGVTVDSQGTIYVADRRNHKIRKITPSGVVSTLAGSTQGFADGTGVNALFDDPTGVAVDSQGTIYVADRDNNKIRKITPSGVVTTLAGSTEGFADGTGANAQFNAPKGVTVDASNNLYVVGENHKIRKITPNGVVSTFAGSTRGFADGTGANAQFSLPLRVAVDSKGTIYVADTGNHKIRKITPSGVVTTLAGSTRGFADGTGANAQFNSPIGVTVDSQGTIYVADSGNNKIRKITQE